ncbi:unnamed protein product [Mycena citricolor]|uniref:Protein kinase domain-containing protein n=1 Tax=Mycena citricolor TaxID=2018698 RepID=A0AAD2HET1_9AGAR|nr:unnamed protein product [Mycena citricolor]
MYTAPAPDDGRVPSTSLEPTHPAPGTLIDNGALELIEVLGVGGYGVVYRAVDAHSPASSRQFAVKCLLNSQTCATSRKRQLHIREIALHQLSSAHPNVVTLHRVVEDDKYTFIIMDFAPDGDLFSQILYGCRYLGNTRLIKHIFNQLLDAVEYCHSLGIYHRDLKPENVLCFDGGYRVALTDFGLATTEKLSEEFRTGSVYHMSPECQGGEFAPTGSYSPMFNDVWSLGIVLLNLATGRNPWKAATISDSTFRAYIHNPSDFLLSVLPISAELNDVLVRMLELDWRDRITIAEIRAALESVTTFYSEGAVFDGSMARCPWEVGVDLEPDAEPSPVKELEQPRHSNWSVESSLVFSHPQATSDASSSTQYSSCGGTWALDSPSASEILADKFMFERPRSPPPITLPISSCSCDEHIPEPLPASLGGTRKPPALTINTTRLGPQYFTIKNASLDSSSTGSSAMQTAVDEEDPWASSFFLGSSKASMVDSASLRVEADKDAVMTSPLVWHHGHCAADDISRYCSTQTSFMDDEEEDSSDSDLRSPTPSPTGTTWGDSCQYSSSFCSVADASVHPRFGAEVPGRSHNKHNSLEPFQSFIFEEASPSPSFETWPALPNPISPSSTQGQRMIRPRPWIFRAKLFGSIGH